MLGKPPKKEITPNNIAIATTNGERTAAIAVAIGIDSASKRTTTILKTIKDITNTKIALNNLSKILITSFQSQKIFNFIHHLIVFNKQNITTLKFSFNFINLVLNPKLYLF